MVLTRMERLERENHELMQILLQMQNLVQQQQSRGARQGSRPQQTAAAAGGALPMLPLQNLPPRPAHQQPPLGPRPASVSNMMAGAQLAEARVYGGGQMGRVQAPQHSSQHHLPLQQVKRLAPPPLPVMPPARLASGSPPDGRGPAGVAAEEDDADAEEAPWKKQRRRPRLKPREGAAEGVNDGVAAGTSSAVATAPAPASVPGVAGGVAAMAAYHNALLAF